MSAQKKGIVWDLDGTLYENTVAMQQAWLDGFYRVARAHGVDLSREEMDKKTWDGFRTHGHAVRAYGQEYGIDEDDFCQELLTHVHARLIDPCPHMPRYLSDHSHMAHAILTSAHREWALPTLQHIGLDHFFGPKRVVGYQDTNGELKSKSEKPFRLAATCLGYDPHECVMVEDTPANLVIARDLGMTTVLVTHGAGPDTTPAHVDFVVEKPYDIFRLIQQGQIPWLHPDPVSPSLPL